MTAIDFTELKKKNKTYAGANGNKISVIYEGEQYMLKFPAQARLNKDMSYSNSCFSEYLGCKIYESIGVPVQKTLLGTYTVKGKKKIDEVLPLFLDFIGDFPIIGHNVRFDYDFIEANIKKLNLKHLKNKIVDTLFLSRITIYDSENHKLETLKKYLNLDYNSHRAVDDCKTCNALYQYCKSKKK